MSLYQKPLQCIHIMQMEREGLRKVLNFEVLVPIFLLFYNFYTEVVCSSGLPCILNI